MTPLSLTPEQQKSLRDYQSAMANTRTPVENPTVAYFGTLGSYTCLLYTSDAADD